jgi:CDP-diacylglycerol---glycerol-3-phosphate 3-phosphatidyltransferase
VPASGGRPIVAAAVLASVLGAFVLSMALYALLGRKRDKDAEGKGAQFFLGFGDFFLHWFLWTIDPLVRASLRLGLTADFYNYAGLLAGLASGVFIALGSLSLGGWALAICGVCDILDGRIARATGVASNYGDFIDSTFDRYVEAAAFLGFALYLRDTRYGPFLAGAALAASLIVSYARARGEVLGVLCTGGLMQRGERLVITTLVCLADPLLNGFLRWTPGGLIQWMLAFIAVTSTITAVHRTYWIAARLR